MFIDQQLSKITNLLADRNLTEEEVFSLKRTVCEIILAANLDSYLATEASTMLKAMNNA